MTQTPSPRSWQLPFIISFLGALAGAALFYGLTMDVAAAVILGAPVGLLVGIIGYRAVPRIMHRSDARTSQLNGASPAPTIEEQPRPAFRMKIKN